ncbi:MAG: PqqD family protein [Anaerolineales bacterium]|nr:PqqD family protein [Anaerolineales bacterium]
MFASDTTITAIRDQTSVDLDDEVAILNLASGVYFGLNEVGAFIWRRLQQPATVAALEAAVLAEYAVTPEQCAADLQKLLADLHAHGLIEARSAHE